MARTIEELKAVKDPVKRALAAKDYIANGEQKLREARNIRDSAIQAYLAKGHSAAQTAEACGVSVGTVRALKRYVR